MATVQRAVQRWIVGVRWGARLIGLAALGLFLWFLAAAGARILPGLSWTDPQGMPMFLFMVLAVVGIVLAWRWEALGGLLALVGGLAVVALAYAGAGASTLWAGALFSLPLVVSGLLDLGCCGLGRAARQRVEGRAMA